MRQLLDSLLHHFKSVLPHSVRKILQCKCRGEKLFWCSLLKLVLGYSYESIHTHTRAHTHTHSHTHITNRLGMTDSSDLNVHMAPSLPSSYKHVCTHTQIYTMIHILLHVCIHMPTDKTINCSSVYVCMYVQMHFSMSF